MAGMFKEFALENIDSFSMPDNINANAGLLFKLVFIQDDSLSIAPDMDTLKIMFFHSRLIIKSQIGKNL